MPFLENKFTRAPWVVAYIALHAKCEQLLKSLIAKQFSFFFSFLTALIKKVWQNLSLILHYSQLQFREKSSWVANMFHCSLVLIKPLVYNIFIHKPCFWLAKYLPFLKNNKDTSFHNCISCVYNCYDLYISLFCHSNTYIPAYILYYLSLNKAFQSIKKGVGNII